MNKRFEHILIVLCGCFILMIILAISLNKLDEPRQQEQQRRFEMSKTITDENGK